MKLVHWFVTAPIALVLVIFAVSNRDSVSVEFWPLPSVLVAPLYLVVLLSLLGGFVIGAFFAWMSAGRRRREARLRARRIEALERELAATQARLPATHPTTLPIAAVPRN